MRESWSSAWWFLTGKIISLSFSFFPPPLTHSLSLSLSLSLSPSPWRCHNCALSLSLSITAFQIFKSRCLPFLTRSRFVSSGTAGDSRLAASPSWKASKETERGKRNRLPEIASATYDTTEHGEPETWTQDVFPFQLDARCPVDYHLQWILVFGGSLGSPQKLPDLQRRVPLGRGPGLQGPGRGTQHHRVGVRGALWGLHPGLCQGASLRAPSTWTQPPSSSAAGQRLLRQTEQNQSHWEAPPHR